MLFTHQWPIGHIYEEPCMAMIQTLSKIFCPNTIDQPTNHTLRAVNWSSTVCPVLQLHSEVDMATTSISMQTTMGASSPALYSTPSPQRARGQRVRTRTPVITSEWNDLEAGRTYGAICLGGDHMPLPCVAIRWLGLGSPVSHHGIGHWASTTSIWTDSIYSSSISLAPSTHLVMFKRAAWPGLDQGCQAQLENWVRLVFLLWVQHATGLNGSGRSVSTEKSEKHGLIPKNESSGPSAKQDVPS
jgi:hypothetical protein